MDQLAAFTIDEAEAGATVAAALRRRLPGASWTQVRALIAARRVTILGSLCLDDARRLRAADIVELLPKPLAKPRDPLSIVTLRHLDSQIVVVEKPAGLRTVRNSSERDWSTRRKDLHPALEDVVPRLIAQRETKERGRGVEPPRLRIVHRLDKDTSGLVVFARTEDAERELGRQFREHTVVRRYLALVLGSIEAQRIESWLVRDRGDGRRGSLPKAPEVAANRGLVESPVGKARRAVTHVEVVERLPNYTLVACRLETGRTHQIRIHLAELGHPICGDKVYRHLHDGTTFPDKSAAPRQALHAVELGFEHPASGGLVHWQMPLPGDFRDLVVRLGGKAEASAGTR